MSALEELEKKTNVTQLELCVLVMRNYQGSNDVSEQAAEELAAKDADLAAAVEALRPFAKQAKWLQYESGFQIMSVRVETIRKAAELLSRLTTDAKGGG